MTKQSAIMSTIDQTTHIESHAISSRSAGPGLFTKARISQTQDAITAKIASQDQSPANRAKGQAEAQKRIPVSDQIAEALISTGTLLLISLQLFLPNFQIIETNWALPNSNPIQTAIISGLMILWAVRECTTLRRLRRLAHS